MYASYMYVERMHRTATLSLDRFRREIDLLDPDLPLAVGSIDIDGFDAVNAGGANMDEGDRVLGAVERAIVEGMPSGAVIGHVKGDEWVIALPDAAPEDLLIAIDGVRRRLAAEGPLPITAGVAGRPQHGMGVDELLAAADTGLVRAKQAGRNKVMIAVEERMVLKSSYYTRPALHRLAKLASRSGHTEAHHLRQALDDHLARHAEML
jgi:diguanylate cyclase (GGDEF)-like protein